MKADFSRDTFDPLRHFSRVLVQQGRLQLDADVNEQSSILLHYLRTLAQDLIGEHGGPGTGFQIGKSDQPSMDFRILPGRYYVNGVLCENDAADFSYSKQGLPAIAPNKTHFVYLDVWERHVSALDDDSLRDVALGQADTTSRAQVMWKVRVASKAPDGTDLPPFGPDGFGAWFADSGWPDAWVAQWQPPQRGLLRAMGRAAATPDTRPCIISPEARFRGLENQLYRVEIHTGGLAKQASFKWSRDNGSVTFAIKALAADGTATLASAGRGDRQALRRNDWVELVDDDAALRGEAGPLALVLSVQPDELTVKLKPAGGAALPSYAPEDFAKKHVQLRRWDYRVNTPSSANTASTKPQQADDGALRIQEDKWLALEDGVQVMFASPAEGQPAHVYRQGDCWFFAARTATGDVEWPGDVGNPEALPPKGVLHYYAPLGMIGANGTEVVDVASFRRTIKPAAE